MTCGVNINNVSTNLCCNYSCWIIIESHSHSHSLSLQSLWQIYWTTVAPRQVGHSKVTKLNAFHTNLPAEVANQRAAIDAAKSQSIICRSVGFSDCAYGSLTVRMSLCLSFCLSLALSVLLSPYTPNTPLDKVLINVARNVAETANISENHHQTVGTYFEQLFHLVSSSSTTAACATSSAAAAAGAAFFRILTLCYVLQMAAKTHGQQWTRGQWPFCSWLVPLLHAGTFPFWSLWQIAVILGHQYLTPSPLHTTLWPFWCQCKVENMPDWLPREPLQLTWTAFEIEIQSPWTSATQCPEA